MLSTGTIIAHILLFISLYFEIFLLVSFFEKRRDLRKQGKKDSTNYPSVTVIVPCFNEEKTLVKTMESLFALDYPKDKLSFFVVDDGSTDTTWSLAKQYEQHPQVRLFQKENGGKYTALNVGIESATTDLVGCLDADSFVDPMALQNIVHRFEDNKIQAVTPAIRVYNAKNVIEHIQVAEYTFSAFIRKVFAFLGTIYITPGPFSFFRREVFQHIGPYRHAHNTEDLEIALRMQTHGLKIDNAHDAYVYTTAPGTLRKLFKQRVRWIHGYLENAKDYRSLFFKTSHGHLSMFILPTATLSIFSAIYFTLFALWHAGVMISDKIVEISSIGFHTPRLPQFDPFFLKTESVVILSFILIFLTIGLIMTGRYILDRKIVFSKDIAYFVFLYSFIAPLWLAKSVYNVAFSRKTSWR